MANKTLFTQDQEKKTRFVHETDHAKRQFDGLGIIIGVKDAYSPTSRFMDVEGFADGITFIVKVNINYSENDEIISIKCNISAEELLGTYGSKGNLIGRHVIIESESNTSYNMSRGKLRFLDSFSHLPEDTDSYIPLSIGGMNGCKFDFKDKIKSLQTRNISTEGYSWTLTKQDTNY